MGYTRTCVCEARTGPHAISDFAAKLLLLIIASGAVADVEREWEFFSCSRLLTVWTHVL
jgi:hypothetical protein